MFGRSGWGGETVVLGREPGTWSIGWKLGFYIRWETCSVKGIAGKKALILSSTGVKKRPVSALGGVGRNVF